MSTYYDEFVKQVQAAHKQSAKFCHWTEHDELTTLTPVKAKGPCDCPQSGKNNAACKPHGCYRCASTDDVLKLRPKSFKKCDASLDDLKKNVDTINTQLDQCMQAYNAGLQAGKTPSEILADPGLDKAAGQHFGVNDPATKAAEAIARLRPLPKPDKKRIDAGCDCVCFKNKLHRLEAEKQLVNELTSETDKLDDAILAEIKALTATFGNTVLPVLKGAGKLVGGLMSDDLGKAADGAKDLVEVVTKNTAYGAKVFVFYMTTLALADYKRIVLLAVMYHDQQAAAPICGTDLDDDDTSDPGSGKAPRQGPF